MAQTALSATRPQPAKELPRSKPDLRYRLFSLLAQPTGVALTLRLFSAKGMGPGARMRWLSAGVPAADLDAVLPQIRSLPDWWNRWQTLAAEREAAAQRALDASVPVDAAPLFLEAYALYNISALGLFLKPERWEETMRRMAACYAQAAPHLDPPAQPVEIPFDQVTLAAYLRVPLSALSGASQRIPVVLLVNGAGAVKEELRSMEEQFLGRGMATLSIDVPGMGESWSRIGWQFDQERVADAALAFLQTLPQIDADRAGLFGISLGGMAVLRMAAHRHHFRAVAAICPPYDGPSYYRIVPFFVRETIRHMTRLERAALHAALPHSSLRGHIGGIRCPLLVIGAGRDTIVPGGDARLIVAEATCEKELIWYADDEHSALNHLREWPERVAGWMGQRLEAGDWKSRR